MHSTDTLILDSLSEIKSSICELKSEVSDLKVKVSQLDTKVTKLDADNREDHSKIFDALNSLNRSFLKSEVEISDKIRILFDADVDRKDHQTIYNQQISNLEKYNKH